MSLSSPFPMVFGTWLALTASTSSRTMALEINIWVSPPYVWVGSISTGGYKIWIWKLGPNFPLKTMAKGVQFEWRELPSQAKMEQNSTASSDEDLPSDRQRKPMHPKPKPPALVHRILVDNGEHDRCALLKNANWFHYILKKCILYMYIKELVFIYAPLILQCFLGSGDFFLRFNERTFNSLTLPAPSYHVAGLTQSTGAPVEARKTNCSGKPSSYPNMHILLMEEIMHHCGCIKSWK